MTALGWLDVPDVKIIVESALGLVDCDAKIFKFSISSGKSFLTVSEVTLISPTDPDSIS